MERIDKDDLLRIRDSYTEDTRHFVAFLNEEDLELDIEGLRRYVEHLKQEGFKAATINKRLTAAKNRLRLLFQDSREAMDVLERFRMETALKEVKGIRRNPLAVDSDRTLSLEEIRVLLRDERIQRRVRLFIEFLVVSGTRVSEMTGIRQTDVREQPEHVAVRIVGKGNKERILKLQPTLVGRIREEFRGRSWLFENSRGRRYDRRYVSFKIAAAGRYINRRISAHTLRHTFATIQVKKNRKVKALSMYLGHASTSITQDMYVHEEVDLEDLDLEL
jgi:site-specific recombinase XerD